MVKVFVVFKVRGDSSCVMGVFKSKEGAEQSRKWHADHTWQIHLEESRDLSTKGLGEDFWGVSHPTEEEFRAAFNDDHEIEGWYIEE